MNTATTEHTVKAFDSDVSELRGLIAEMGGRSVLAVRNAMAALERRDARLAAQIVADDVLIDALEQRVNSLTVKTMALRAPLADDLREMVAILKISGTLERIGDHAKNIARIVPIVGTRNLHMPMSQLTTMAALAAAMVDGALEAFARRSTHIALEVCDRDQAVDDHHQSIFGAIITEMRENPDEIARTAHFLIAAKNLERVGDHATNIAEMVYFAATGTNLPNRERHSEAATNNRGEH